jgi:transposase
VKAYAGPQFVGIDLHRRRSVIVRMTAAGEVLETTRIVNDADRLAAVLRRAGESPEVVLEATYGWYWAADVLAAGGAWVHLAHPLGVKAFAYRRVKNDVRDASDLADLLRMGRLPEAWIAPPAVRELRELVRYRDKLARLQAGLKAQVHQTLGKEGIIPATKSIWWSGGQQWLDELPMAAAETNRVESLRDLLELYHREIDQLDGLIYRQLKSRRPSRYPSHRWGASGHRRHLRG